MYACVFMFMCRYVYTYMFMSICICHCVYMYVYVCMLNCLIMYRFASVIVRCAGMYVVCARIYSLYVCSFCGRAYLYKCVFVYKCVCVDVRVTYVCTSVRVLVVQRMLSL